MQEKAEMKSPVQHYPVRFYFELIQQAAERLETKDAPSSIARSGRHVLSTLYGGVHILHLHRDAERVDINPMALENAYTKCRDAIADFGVLEKQWYEVLRTLIAAKLLVLKLATKIKTFIDT